MVAARTKPSTDQVIPRAQITDRRYLPLGIDVAGLPCLVVGGGRIGTRKAMTLADAGARVTVLSPEVSPDLGLAADRGLIEWQRAEYSSSRLAGWRLVVAATADPELNIRIAHDAEEQDIFHCVVCPGRFSRVIFPAVYADENLTVAVHSHGRNCAASRAIRDTIAAMLSQGDKSTSELVVFGANRQDVPQTVFAALAEDARQLKADRVRVSDTEELLILVTCQRWECYFLSASPRAGARGIRKVLQERCGLLLESHLPALYLKHGRAAHYHLLRVASGLGSPLVGETEIIGQIRDARDAWLGERDSALRKLFDGVLHMQKLVRKTSALRAVGKSWADRLLVLLENHLSLNPGRVLLIGCGRLGREVTQELMVAGIRVITVSKRAAEGVDWCARAGLQVHSPEETPKLLPKVNAVVLSCGDREERQIVMRRLGREKSLAVFDLAGDIDGKSLGRKISRYYGLNSLGRSQLGGQDVARISLAEKLVFQKVLAQFPNPGGPVTGPKHVRVGGRRSALSLAQIDEVLEFLGPLLPGTNFEVQALDTPGDRDRLTPLPEVKEDDFFTRDLDRALLAGRIDLAVHSAKDLPAALPDGLCLAALLPAFAPWECLVAREAGSLAELPAQATVGTSSLRRQAGLNRLRPELHPLEIRGDVPDRLAQLDAGKYDALILAVAGLVRLGLAERITQVFTAAELPPAPGQGALALLTRADDSALRELLRPLDLGDREELR